MSAHLCLSVDRSVCRLGGHHPRQHAQRLHRAYTLKQSMCHNIVLASAKSFWEVTPFGRQVSDPVLPQARRGKGQVDRVAAFS